MTLTIPLQIIWLSGAIAAWWLIGYVILTAILARVPGMALSLPRHTIRMMRWGGPLLVMFAFLMASDRRRAARMRAEYAAERKAEGLADEPRIF